MKRCKFFYLCTTFLAIALTAVFLVLMFEPETSRAAGLWYVAPGGNNTNDCKSPGNPCATINGALAKPAFVSGDTVLVAAGVYTGTGDEVVKIKNIDVILSGGWAPGFSVQNGYSTIDGEGERRGIDIDSEYGYPTNINFERIEVRDCDDSGIRNHGILTMTDSIVQSNYGLLGGGINNSNMLSLKNSTVNGNSSKYSGGGIHNSGTLELMNSTVKDNQTEGDGGGIETSVFELYTSYLTL